MNKEIEVASSQKWMKKYWRTNTIEAFIFEDRSDKAEVTFFWEIVATVLCFAISFANLSSQGSVLASALFIILPCCVVLPVTYAVKNHYDKLLEAQPDFTWWNSFNGWMEALLERLPDQFDTDPAILVTAGKAILELEEDYWDRRQLENELRDLIKDDRFFEDVLRILHAAASTKNPHTLRVAHDAIMELSNTQGQLVQVEEKEQERRDAIEQQYSHALVCAQPDYADEIQAIVKLRKASLGDNSVQTNDTLKKGRLPWRLQLHKGRLLEVMTRTTGWGGRSATTTGCGGASIRR